MIRRRANRVAARIVTTALEVAPSLEQFVAAYVDKHRLQLAVARLVRGGTTIQTVYDIGANRGDWTRSIQAVLPGATFVLFEGNPVHREALAAVGGPVVIAVLAEAEREVDWHASGGPGDSYHRELTSHYADVTPIRVGATTLDRVVERERLPLPDLIKADVQGAELDILTGGSHALTHAAAVLLECPIVPYNDGAPSIDEYFAFMDDAGFAVDECVDRHRRDGRTIHVDVLFIRVPK